MEFEFESVLIEWRGPAPFVFAPIPEEESKAIKALAKRASYGWGCIPVLARIGETEFTTSIMPKDGRFLVPVKAAVQKAESIAVGDRVRARVQIEFR
ncbi:MAG: DUF1905 domain-containing protein [Armatimonadota bacterium]